MKHSVKRWAAALSAVMVLSLAGCAKAGPEDFDRFMDEEFVSAMESDYITAHTYLEDPSAFGVDLSETPVNLGSRPTDDGAEARKALEKRYKEFQRFDREKLTADQQDTYDIYQYNTELSLQLGDEKFDYYAPLFQSMSGLHYQLPVLFADWEIRSEEYLQNLITLVADTKPYVDSALDYTREQAERGLLMVDAQSVAEYCQGIASQGEQSAILTSMLEGVDGLGLPEEKASACRQQLTDAFVTSFIPAYQAIAETMTQLDQSGKNNQEGLARFPKGKEYYELLLQKSIGSNKTPQEIWDMMDQAYYQHIVNLQDIITQSPESVMALAEGKLPSTGYGSYEEMLQDIQGVFFEDFPQVADLTYNIRDVNPEIASSSGVAAYFNIPPLDGTSPKQLRVNPLTSDVGSLSTYSTVAHEGFPGHMYQYAYLYENQTSLYRKALADVLAYVEGYAVCAQYEAMNYLSVDPYLLAAWRENELASYCVMIQADIGIHYYGWDLEKFQSFLEERGFVMETEDARLQYQQLQANPCAFEPYYVGYHEIAALKEEARAQLGESFDDREFNRALLDSGPAPFSVVERQIQEYISSAGSEMKQAA